MIHEVSGGILLTQAAAIAHGVSPDDHFAQGLAFALRDRWPTMTKDFRHWSHQSTPKPGTAWIWGGADGARRACLLTQENASLSHGAHNGKSHVEHVNHSWFFSDFSGICPAWGIF